MSRSSGSFDIALDRLQRFHPKSLDLSLGRVHRLLAALGHPERRLPPVIHVAGTNGKGSTVAFLRAILESAGLRVHATISPHLVHYNERIRVAGCLLEEDELLAAIDHVERVNADQPISFFEITTVLALHLFAETPADAVLLETGLGGRWDATNVVDRPAATIITRISYDHTHLLGDTITEIASEKAGIIKPGVPVILAYQADDDAVQVVRRQARALEAPLFAHGCQWSVTPVEDGFVYQDTAGRLDLPHPGLLGAHQIDNAGAAISALRHCGRFALSRDAYSAGVAGVVWPARLQHLTRGPLLALIPPGSELWLDGGHNDSGGEVLAMQAARWADKPLALVFGMLNTKQPVLFLQPLAAFAEAVRSIRIPGQALSLSAVDACAAAKAVGMPCCEADTLENAIRSLTARADGPQRILICGSLYLAGHVLAAHG